MQKVNWDSIRVEKTASEKWMNTIGAILFATSFLYFIICFFNMPAAIPTHVNSVGEIDGYGSKWLLFILPIIVIPFLLLMNFLESNPAIQNYPERLNKQNAAAFYLQNRQTVNYVKNIALMLFAYILLRMTGLGLNGSTTFGWPIVVMIVMAFVVVIIYKGIQIRKVK